MSTVVLTLVVVGGSIAVAARLAASGELKPATEPGVPHRAPRRSRRRQAAVDRLAEVATVDLVPPRPGILRRLAASFTLVAITAMLGAAIALGLLAGATFIGRALETAVQ